MTDTPKSSKEEEEVVSNDTQNVTPPVSRLQVLFSEVNKSTSKNSESSPLRKVTTTPSNPNHKDASVSSSQRNKHGSSERKYHKSFTAGGNKLKSTRSLSFGEDNVQKSGKKEGYSKTGSDRKEPNSENVASVYNSTPHTGESPRERERNLRRKARSEFKKKKQRFSTNSDSELMGAKELIEKAITTKEQRQRRLTEQLEYIEAELLQKPNKNSSLLVKGKRPTRDSDISINSLFSDHQNASVLSRKSIDTLFESEEVLRKSLETREGQEAVEMKHAQLKAEHFELKEEINGMRKQLVWIKRQLDATQGHARLLSKSTTDWADMMKRTQHSASLNAKKQAIQRGAIVTKHSTTKRGCGGRFLAFDESTAVLMWSKTISGSLAIVKHISGCTAIKEDLKNNDVSCIPVGNIKLLVHGNDIMMLSFKSKLILSEETCQRTIGFKSVVDDIEKVTVFEFCDVETSSDFFYGMKAAMNDPSCVGLSWKGPYLKHHAVSPLITPCENQNRNNTPVSTLEDNQDEENGQTRYISDIQKDLRKIRSRDDYINTLKSHTMECPLMLPLKSSRIRRHSMTDLEQVKKDFTREKFIIINARTFKLGNEGNLDAVMKYLKKRLVATQAASGSNENYEVICNDLLLAASRTVMEGDVFTLCHQLLSIPGKVILCPAQTEQTTDTSCTPVEIFFAAGGLITIESETSYKILGIINDGRKPDEPQNMEEWALVKTRCIEHISYSDIEEERNIRHVKMMIQEM